MLHTGDGRTRTPTATGARSDHATKKQTEIINCETHSRPAPLKTYPRLHDTSVFPEDGTTQERKKERATATRQEIETSWPLRCAVLCCAMLWWHAKPKRRKAAARAVMEGGREGCRVHRVINELSPRDTFVPSPEEYFKCYRLDRRTEGWTDGRTDE